MKDLKRTSKHNAIRHGILADILLIDDHMGESSETYRRMLSALKKSMRPVDGYGELLVEKLAFLFIRLTRIYEADWRVAPKLFKRIEQAVEADNPFITKELFDPGGEVIGQRRDPTPELLLRYESNIERQISRTIDQFERWSMIRPSSSKPPTELDDQVKIEAEETDKAVS